MASRLAVHSQHRTWIRWMLAALVIVLLSGLCLHLMHGRYPLDLRIYLLGGHAIRSGAELYGPATHIRGYGFTYPPSAALLFALLALLPVAVVFLMLTLGSLISLGAVLRLSDRELVTRILRDHSWRAAGLIILMATFEPVRTNLSNAQINLVLAAALMLDLLLPQRRWSGVLTGLATAVKLTPGLFVVYLILRRRHGQAARAVAAFAAAAAVAFAVRPHDSATYWTTELSTGTGLGDTANGRNHGVFGLLLRMHPSHAAQIWVVVALVLGAACLRIAMQVSIIGREPLALGVVGLTACVISPVSWSHHWVWFIPAFAGLAGWGGPPRLAVRVWLVVMAAYLTGIQLAPPSWVSTHAVTRAININAYLVLAIGTFVVVQAQIRRASRPVRAEQLGSRQT